MSDHSDHKSEASKPLSTMEQMLQVIMDNQIKMEERFAARYDAMLASIGALQPPISDHSDHESEASQPLSTMEQMLQVIMDNQNEMEERFAARCDAMLASIGVTPTDFGNDVDADGDRDEYFDAIDKQHDLPTPAPVPGRTPADHFGRNPLPIPHVAHFRPWIANFQEPTCHYHPASARSDPASSERPPGRDATPLLRGPLRHRPHVRPVRGRARNVPRMGAPAPLHSRHWRCRPQYDTARPAHHRAGTGTDSARVTRVR